MLAVAMSPQGEKTDTQVSWPSHPASVDYIRAVASVYLSNIYLAQKSRTHTSPRHYGSWLGQVPSGAPRHVRG